MSWLVWYNTMLYKPNGQNQSNGGRVIFNSATRPIYSTVADILHC